MNHDVARSKAYIALRKGEIKRDNCKHCGSDFDLQMHHEDYNSPYDITWLCRECHIKEHKRIGNFKQNKRWINKNKKKSIHLYLDNRIIEELNNYSRNNNIRPNKIMEKLLGEFLNLENFVY